MAEPEVYTIDYNSLRVLSESLGNHEQWVCWKWGPRRKNGKRSKLPCNPDTGELAKANDGTTWGTWDEVCAGSEAGIGFMLTSDDPYSVLDLDNCRNPRTGQIAEWADELVREFGSLTFVSASGTGLHIWVEGMLPVGGFNNKQGIEGYSSRHFIVITGQVHAGERIESRQEALDALYGTGTPYPCKPSAAILEALRTTWTTSGCWRRPGRAAPGENSRTSSTAATPVATTAEPITSCSRCWRSGRDGTSREWKGSSQRARWASARNGGIGRITESGR